MITQPYATRGMPTPFSGYTAPGSYGYAPTGNPNPNPTDLSRFGSTGGAYAPPSRLGGGQFGGGSFAGGGNPGGASPGVSVLSRVKNPTLDAAQGAATGNYNASNSANQSDLGKYAAAVGANADNNNFFYNQESNAIGDLYSGKALSTLNGYTNDYANTAGGLAGKLGQDLAASRSAYNTNESGAIGKEAADRAAMESNYKATAQGTLDDAIKQLTANRSDYQKAAQAGTELSISDADKQRKAAMAATGGYGGQSYFARQAMDTRAHANAALNADLANRSRQDFGLVHGEQVALNSDLADRMRADYGLTREESARLAANINSQERGDTAYVYGQNAGVNRDVMQNNLGAYQFVSGQQGRLAGLRSRIGAQNAQDLLGPVTARTALTNSQLQQLAALGGIDRGNRFYGLDDGGAGTSGYFGPAGHSGQIQKGGGGGYPEGPGQLPVNQVNPANPALPNPNAYPGAYPQAAPDELSWMDNLDWSQVPGGAGYGAYAQPNYVNRPAGGTGSVKGVNEAGMPYETKFENGQWNTYVDAQPAG